MSRQEIRGENLCPSSLEVLVKIFLCDWMIYFFRYCCVNCVLQFNLSILTCCWSKCSNIVRVTGSCKLV